MKGIVYNTSDYPFTEDAGRFGRWVFPPKPDGQPYSVTEIPDYEFKHDRGDDQFEMRKADGYEMAVDLVSKNEGFGCFAKSEYEKPTQADVDKARATMAERDKELVLRASSIWESTHDHKLINGNARNAARRLGYKVEWALDDAAFTVFQCPFCMESVKRGAIKCGKCNEYLTEELNPNLAKIGWSRDKAIPVIEPKAVALVEEEKPFAVTKVSAAR